MFFGRLRQQLAGLRALFVLATLALAASPAFAHDPTAGEAESESLDEILITGRAESLVGLATSASTGRVGQDEIQNVPFLRTGEVLERVPGLIATQHSGAGKGNQFFLRGFNLDHGTDFSFFLEGVPLNLTTHGHGQGYLDVNLLIPELIGTLEFRKGPYFADVGDFSSAGTSSVDYVDRLDRPFVQLSLGEYEFSRFVAGTSHEVGGGDLLLGGEVQFYDGPWRLDQNLEKFNGIAKWSWRDGKNAVSIFASAYASDWDSTDQIALRAVESGLVDRFGNLDDDLGGETSRYTASVTYTRGLELPLRLQAFVSVYELDLWSNFTYLLDDPVNGDEFKQVDRRTVLGFMGSQAFHHHVGPLEISHTAGLQIRHDIIDEVGLFNTAERQRLATVRQDEAEVTNVGLYWEATVSPTDWLRAYAGVRGDLFYADIDAISRPENGGSEFEGIATPKLGLIFGPWAETEFYLNYGRGFHSNDARGTTIQTDPSSGAPAERVDFIADSDGAEFGVRTTAIRGLQSTVSVWWLELESELLFVGDAGTTEASRPSRRYGVEFANHYRPLDWLTFDLDVTLTESEFRDNDPAGDEIPGAVETTVAAGAAIDLPSGYFGSLRLRHFGERPLIEDGSFESDPTTIVNISVGKRRISVPHWGELSIRLDVLNLFDSNDDDITYAYASRLAGEPAEGVEDIHFHPVEPRMVRGTVEFAWGP